MKRVRTEVLKIESQPIFHEINAQSAEVWNECIHQMEMYQWRRGYGKYLMDFSIAHMENSDVEQIDLLVRRGNVRAISLYKKYGFEYGDIRIAIYDNGEDGLLYSRQIKG
ncbi:hypothetical protein C6496_03075 [Candidatus Poribacteria bacterium]|nr:MAG: hypothetical protein C6496_03075 [Candidatus Poribacteria bacterium]